MVRPAHLLLPFILGALLLPVVSALGMDRLGWAMTPASARVAFWLPVALLVTGGLLAWRRRHGRVEWNWPALAELIVLAGSMAGSAVYLFWLAGPPFLPVGTSVDGGWHYALSDHIHSGNRLGVHHPRLGNVNSYTPGFHLLVALLAHWTGREPIYTLYPAIVLAMAAGIGLTAQLAMDGVPAGPWRPLAGLGALLALTLMPPSMTIEMIARQQFYPTAAGIVWLLTSVWAGGLLHRSNRPVALGLAAVGLFGIVLFYPFWIAIGLGTLVALAVVRHWGAWRRLGLELAILLGATGLGFGMVRDLVSDQLAFVQAGESRFQPAVVALLTIFALTGFLIGRMLRRQRALPLLILAALALVQFATLRFGLQQVFAQYMAHKTQYLLPHVAIALGVAALSFLLQLLPDRPIPRRSVTGLMLAALCGAAIIGWEHGIAHWPARGLYHPLRVDQIEVALWARDHLQPDPNDVAYIVDDSITAYWLKIGILRSTRGWSATGVLDYSPPRYSYWATDPATPPYALVANVEDMLVGPQARLLHQHGAARFFQRADAGSGAAERRATHIQVFTTIEQFARRPTIRTAAYLSGLPTAGYHLRFLLTQRATGDDLPPVLWQQPLDTEVNGAARYGLVRLDPENLEAQVWIDGAPRPVEPLVLPRGTPLSGWMQLVYQGQPVATRRIYDVVAGDAGSLVTRDFNPNSIFHWERPARELPAPRQRGDMTFGNRLALDRWEIGERQVGGGMTTTLTLEWRAIRPVEPPARLFVHLIGADQSSHAVFDGEPHHGVYPFWLWRPGEVVRDRYTLTIPAHLPAGDYLVVAGVYNPVTSQALPVALGRGGETEPAARLGTLRIR